MLMRTNGRNTYRLEAIFSCDRRRQSTRKHHNNWLCLNALGTYSKHTNLIRYMEINNIATTKANFARWSGQNNCYTTFSMQFGMVKRISFLAIRNFVKIRVWMAIHKTIICISSVNFIIFTCIFIVLIRFSELQTNFSFHFRKSVIKIGNVRTNIVSNDSNKQIIM